MKKRSLKPNQISCIIYAIGLNAENVANRMEQHAHDHNLMVVDTIIKKNPGIEELEYYLENSSINAVLLRRLEDISTNDNEIRKILMLAAKHGISVNCEDAGYKPVMVNYEDDV